MSPSCLKLLLLQGIIAPFALLGQHFGFDLFLFLIWGGALDFAKFPSCTSPAAVDKKKIIIISVCEDPQSLSCAAAPHLPMLSASDGFKPEQLASLSDLVDQQHAGNGAAAMKGEGAAPLSFSSPDFPQSGKSNHDNDFQRFGMTGNHPEKQRRSSETNAQSADLLMHASNEAKNFVESSIKKVEASLSPRSAAAAAAAASEGRDASILLLTTKEIRDLRYLKSKNDFTGDEKTRISSDTVIRSFNDLEVRGLLEKFLVKEFAEESFNFWVKVKNFKEKYCDADKESMAMVSVTSSGDDASASSLRFPIIIVHFSHFSFFHPPPLRPKGTLQ